MVTSIISNRIWFKLWWKFCPGVTISIVKPLGIISGSYTQDTDMNAIMRMRPWLEQNVGRRGLDWDWKFKFSYEQDEIKIKFRKGKEQWATMAQLIWE